MNDVFLSYQSDDSAIAQGITRSLERRGINVFFDREALVAGEEFNNAILDALRDARIVLVLLSRHSKRSTWVEAQLQDALDSKTDIIPVLLDEHAKENWVWPLLADRQAIVKEPDMDLGELVVEVTLAVTKALKDSSEKV
jgi:hypothetical protein